MIALLNSKYLVMMNHNQIESSRQDSALRHLSVLEYLIWEYYSEREEDNHLADISTMKRIYCDEK
jgi:hypothetical protein